MLFPGSVATWDWCVASFIPLLAEEQLSVQKALCGNCDLLLLVRALDENLLTSLPAKLLHSLTGLKLL